MRRLLLIPLIAAGVAILSCEQQTPQAPDDLSGIQFAQEPANADQNANGCVCERRHEQQTGGRPKRKTAKKKTVTINYRDDACDEEGECECPKRYDPVEVGDLIIPHACPVED